MLTANKFVERIMNTPDEYLCMQQLLEANYESQYDAERGLHIVVEQRAREFLITDPGLTPLGYRCPQRDCEGQPKLDRLQRAVTLTGSCALANECISAKVKIYQNTNGQHTQEERAAFNHEIITECPPDKTRQASYCPQLFCSGAMRLTGNDSVLSLGSCLRQETPVTITSDLL